MEISTVPSQSLFESAEEFWRHLEVLNALMDPHFQWAQTQAAKDHVDDFGEDIRSGELYYRRPTVGSFNTHSKLSRRSMERLLYAVV